MMQYAFCYPNNRYDTLELGMRIDLAISQRNITELIDFKAGSLSVQKIFLKREQMNQTLIAYLRSLFKQKFYPKPDQLV